MMVMPCVAQAQTATDTFQQFRKGMMEGYTGNYIRVEREYDPALVNKLVDVIL